MYKVNVCVLQLITNWSATTRDVYFLKFLYLKKIIGQSCSLSICLVEDGGCLCNRRERFDGLFLWISTVNQIVNYLPYIETFEIDIDRVELAVHVKHYVWLDHHRDFHGVIHLPTILLIDVISH